MQSDEDRLQSILQSIQDAQEEIVTKEDQNSKPPFPLEMVHEITIEQVNFLQDTLEWESASWRSNKDRRFGVLFGRLNRSFSQESRLFRIQCEEELAALSGQEVPTAPLLFLLAEAYLASNEILEVSEGGEPETRAKVALTGERGRKIKQLKAMEATHAKFDVAFAKFERTLDECLKTLNEESAREREIDRHLEHVVDVLHTHAWQNVVLMQLDVDDLARLVPRTGKPGQNPAIVYLAYYGIVELLSYWLGGTQNTEAAELLGKWGVNVKVATAQKWKQNRDKKSRKRP
jgi:hypothetical protein